MSRIYCFFSREKSMNFQYELKQVMYTDNFDGLKKIKLNKINIESYYREIIERIVHLKKNQFLIIFHPDEKKRESFKLQIFSGKDRDHGFYDANHFYDCNLHLMRNDYEYSPHGGEVMYVELRKKDFLTTLSEDEFIFRMLDRYEDRAKDTEEMFKYVEGLLTEIRNYNYLLLNHKLTHSDLILKEIIDHSQLEQDRFVVSRFLRLKKKEIEGRRIISNKEEGKHYFSLDLNINAEKLSLDFDYSLNGLRKTRTHTIVGKNAAGKSQALIQISKSNFTRYHKNTFLYGVDENNNANKNSFKYLNLIKTKRNSFKEDIGKIIELDKNVFYFNRKNLLKDIANNVLGIDDIVLLDENGNFISLFSDNLEFSNSIIDLEIIANNANYLSTGQGYFLKLIVSLVSNIRYGSLLLIDEPEVFLHPNYIKELISVLERILSYTNSVCVLSTHSVFIVREMPKEYVRILYRDKKTNVGGVRTPAHETFGESLDILADEIFHDEDIKGFGEKYLASENIDLKKLSSRLASRVMNYD